MPGDAARIRIPFSTRSGPPPAEVGGADGRKSGAGLVLLPLNDAILLGKESATPWPEPQELPRKRSEVAEVFANDVQEFVGAGDYKPPKLTIRRERGLYGSIIVHLLVVLALILQPRSRPSNPNEELNDANDPLGIQRLLRPDPTPPPIPAQFFPAPGPKAPQAGPRPLPSDLNRKAGGGDQALPKMTQPMSAPKPGIQDLDAGAKKRTAEVVPTPSAPPPSQVGQKGETSPSLLALKQQPGGIDAGRRPNVIGIPQPSLSSIRPEDAAREGREGSGDEGAGYARQGGFVDSGPLSFDTKGYDWGAYAAEMIRRIKRNWEVPQLAQYGVKGRLTIRFYILKDGTVEAERIIASSGIPPFDNAAYQAISRSNPFRALPPDLGHDREGVTVTFFYNIHPEDEPFPPR
jgi:TonB family protein